MFSKVRKYFVNFFEKQLSPPKNTFQSFKKNLAVWLLSTVWAYAVIIMVSVGPSPWAKLAFPGGNITAIVVVGCLVWKRQPTSSVYKRKPPQQTGWTISQWLRQDQQLDLYWLNFQTCCCCLAEWYLKQNSIQTFSKKFCNNPHWDFSTKVSKTTSDLQKFKKAV